MKISCYRKGPHEDLYPQWAPKGRLCVVSCTVCACHLGSSATAGDMTQLSCGGLDAAKSMGLDMAKSMGLDAAKSWLSSLRNVSNWHVRPKVWENYKHHK